MSQTALPAMTHPTILLGNRDQARGARLRNARVMAFGAAAQFRQRATVNRRGDFRRVIR